MKKLIILSVLIVTMASLTMAFTIQYPPGGVGSGSGLTNGTAVGDIPVWDGDSYEPGVVTGSVSSANIASNLPNKVVTQDYYQGITANGVSKFKGIASYPDGQQIVTPGVTITINNFYKNSWTPR